MEQAKQWYKGELEISFYCTQYEEDHCVIPAGFNRLSDLSRSVLDVNSKLSGKKLPLIADILDKREEMAPFDYLIYTNVDIALMPHFYGFVENQLKKGHDAIVINRRRISNSYNFPDEINLMYSDIGYSHPGFDCFVIKKELLTKFCFKEICIGIPFLEVSFIHNIASFSENPLYVFDGHLTFHLGTEVLSNRKKDYFYWHNRNLYFKEIRPRLSAHYKLSKFPYFSEPIFLRLIKWSLNPALFTREYIKLESTNQIHRWKNFVDEIRWKILQR